MKRMAAVAAYVMLAAGADRRPRLLPVEGDIEGVHDPVVMKQGNTYYVFSTGGRANGGVLPMRCSEDLQHWRLCGSALAQLPEWAPKEIPGARSLWAPDISYFNGRYHLYYSISTFGKNESAIGLLTNPTLDERSPQYKWSDQGLVIRSRKEDDWNAIDPNLVIEDGKRHWLTWGSFWGGIKMKAIDPRTGKPPENAVLQSLAARPRTDQIRGSIEAPFIVRRNGFWYLFVSFDFCCKGAKSTYNVVVGRSRQITGPYLDRDGQAMLEGGGTPVVSAATEKWRGAGHQAVLREKGQDYLFFHAYQGTTGRPTLRISTMEWHDGWPIVAALP